MVEPHLRRWNVSFRLSGYHRISAVTGVLGLDNRTGERSGFSMLSLDLTSSFLIKAKSRPALSALQSSIRELNTTLAPNNFDDMRRVRDFMKFRIDRAAVLDDEILVDLLQLVEECKRLAARDNSDEAVKVELRKLYDALQTNLGTAKL